MFKNTKTPINEEFVKEYTMYKNYYKLFSNKQISLKAALDDETEETKKAIILIAFSNAVKELAVSETRHY